MRYVYIKNMSALYSAARYGHAPVVALLIEAGANLHVHNDGALRAARQGGHTEVVALLNAAIAREVEAPGVVMGVGDDERDEVQRLKEGWQSTWALVNTLTEQWTREMDERDRLYQEHLTYGQMQVPGESSRRVFVE